MGGRDLRESERGKFLLVLLLLNQTDGDGREHAATGEGTYIDRIQPGISNSGPQVGSKWDPSGIQLQSPTLVWERPFPLF